MNNFQKQLVLNDGRTVYEHAKDKVGGPLDCSNLDIGEPPPAAHRVSVEEFQKTLAKARKSGGFCRT